ncbi:cupin domain-containing protein [Jidongwangia harbinensis]|uniref:cupin domain-containing protein n=1 Tax=Jidongwangia harbinensis TaxID=2878561 RepID=UPI001CD9AAFB|nr:cupin domain-containing protein [Jidongwangia harbinensis]MCA2214870.1 cupin domain-containing protein [Jidongwangia harbinensis]
MPIVRRSEAVAHRMHGTTFHSFAAPSRGSAELCAWRVEFAPGSAGVAHRVGREEVFLQLTGELTVTVDGVTGTLGAGDVLVVPAGGELTIDNPSAEPGTAWVTTSVGFQATLPDGSTISPPWTR